MLKSRVEIIVRGYHTDFYGHVNNARYLEFLEEGRWAFVEKILFSDYFIDNNLGFSVVNININYRAPATMRNVIVVESSVKHAGEKSITLHQAIKLKDTDKLIADADVTFVIVDKKIEKAIPLNTTLKKLFL